MNNGKVVSVFESTDIEKNKVMSALSYIIFFLPLIACPGSSYGRFHANQALLLLIVNGIGRLLIRFIPVVGGAFMTVFSLAILALTVYCMINAYRGRAWRLPVVGDFNILS